MPSKTAHPVSTSDNSYDDVVTSIDEGRRKHRPATAIRSQVDQDAPRESPHSNHINDGDDGRGTGGGGGSGGDQLEMRVAALEKGFQTLDGKLDKLIELVTAGRLENEKRFGTIESRLTGIETELKAKADKTDFSPIDIRLAGIEINLTNKAAKTDLDPINTKLGTVDGRVASLPTFWSMVGIIGTFIIGITTAGFGVAKLLEKPAPQPMVAPAPQTPAPTPAQRRP